MAYTKKTIEAGNIYIYVFACFRAIFDLIGDEYPIGLGLGQKNQDRFSERYALNRYKSESGEYIKPGATTMFSAFGSAAGYIGVIIFLVILGCLVVPKETRYLGIGVVVLASIWGGAFEGMIWLLISVSYHVSSKELGRARSGPSNLRGEGGAQAMASA